MAVTEGDVERFSEKVFARSRQLIATRVWSGVDAGRLESWIAAFKDYDAAILAAALLDNLIYRSKAQFHALFEAMLLELRLPGLPDDHDTAFVQSLSSRQDPGVRFAPVIAPDQPPTKSGPYALRLLQRQFRVRDQWLIWPHQIATVPDSTRYVFLLDDFTGTGDQFWEFWSKMHLDSVRKDRPELQIVLLASVIHEQGLQRIRKDIPGLHVVYSELLGQQHHFTQGGGLDQYQLPALKEQITERLEHICKTCRIGGGRVTTYGFGQLGLCYAFEHATPNNTLPIYWFDSDHWAPLLSR